MRSIKIHIMLGFSSGLQCFSFFASRKTNFLTIENTGGSGVNMGTAGLILMQIQNTGNVSIPTGTLGINTDDTQGYTLAVNGPMIATKVVVKLKTDWPDFVFAENHTLKSLAET